MGGRIRDPEKSAWLKVGWGGVFRVVVEPACKGPRARKRGNCRAYSHDVSHEGGDALFHLRACAGDDFVLIGHFDAPFADLKVPSFTAMVTGRTRALLSKSVLQHFEVTHSEKTRMEAAKAPRAKSKGVPHTGWGFT